MRIKLLGKSKQSIPAAAAISARENGPTSENDDQEGSAATRACRKVRVNLPPGNPPTTKALETKPTQRCKVPVNCGCAACDCGHREKPRPLIPKNAYVQSAPKRARSCTPSSKRAIPLPASLARSPPAPRAASGRLPGALPDVGRCQKPPP